MRANTQKIFERLSKGAFLSVDSTDLEIKHLYNDIEENYADYETYFLELGLRLEAGDGYFYFSRTHEAKLTIEQKLQSFAQWVDILDFLKTYDLTFSTGFQFRSTHILGAASSQHYRGSVLSAAFLPPGVPLPLSQLLVRGISTISPLLVTPHLA